MRRTPLVVLPVFVLATGLAWIATRSQSALVTHRSGTLYEPGKLVGSAQSWTYRSRTTYLNSVHGCASIVFGTHDDVAQTQEDLRQLWEAETGWHSRMIKKVLPPRWQWLRCDLKSWSDFHVLGFGYVHEQTAGRGFTRSVSIPYWSLIVAGTSWWMMLWLPDWKRQRRMAASRCVSCGYDLSGIAGAACPECGKPSEKR